MVSMDYECLVSILYLYIYFHSLQIVSSLDGHCAFQIIWGNLLTSSLLGRMAILTFVDVSSVASSNHALTFFRGNFFPCNTWASWWILQFITHSCADCWHAHVTFQYGLLVLIFFLVCNGAWVWPCSCSSKVKISPLPLDAY